MIALTWRGDATLALIVAAALAGSMLVASLTEALVPLLWKTPLSDPALAFGVILTTFTDVCGILFLFGLSPLFLPALL